MSTLGEGKDICTLSIIYPSHVDFTTFLGKINWKEEVIDEYKKGQVPGTVGKATGRRYIIGTTDDVYKTRGRGRNYHAIIDGNKHHTVNVKAGRALDSKMRFKVEVMTLKAFWLARSAVKRDYLLLGFAIMAGSFIPFLLKFIASMAGRVVPW